MTLMSPDEGELSGAQGAQRQGLLVAILSLVSAPSTQPGRVSALQGGGKSSLKALEGSIGVFGEGGACCLGDIW